jgi:hypothetical protein
MLTYADVCHTYAGAHAIRMQARVAASVFALLTYAIRMQARRNARLERNETAYMLTYAIRMPAYV